MLGAQEIATGLPIVPPLVGRLPLREELVGTAFPVAHLLARQATGRHAAYSGAVTI